jgi:ferredoxin/flavodoxin---NADP+ reductase
VAAEGGARGPGRAVVETAMNDLPSVLRVAVVGAGPSGFYAAESLLKQRPDAIVDLFDRLPAPFGLVRYGVAPDHQKIKSVTKVYDRLLADPRVRFRGNVDVGRDLSADDLRRHYHATVFTYGAASDRQLRVPGETLDGSLSATHFVGWYNGHPDFVDLNPRLDGPTALVVGVGNVAVDVTRILAKTPAELVDSDIADHALEALARSAVRDVVVIGRRGPAEAKWSTKELRDLGDLEDADVLVDPADLELTPESRAALDADPIARRNYETLLAFAAKPPRGASRRIHLRFLLSPVSLEPDASGTRVAAVVLEHNRLEAQPDGSVAAVGTGETERLDASLVFRSVGYRGEPLPEVPFDPGWAVVPNDRGHVLTARGGDPVPGWYVAGWIKRGPTGVIGTNKACAVETIATLLGDELPAIDPADARPEAVDALLAARGVHVVDADAWRRIDARELAAGAQLGRPRVKLVTRSDLLADLD